jgi:hypothetical protein
MIPAFDEHSLTDRSLSKSKNDAHEWRYSFWAGTAHTVTHPESLSPLQTENHKTGVSSPLEHAHFDHSSIAAQVK